MKQKRKNIKINNEGFSMVEILAVVVILGIVSTIGIVSITKLIDKSRQHYYDTQESQLVLAAQAYAANNKQVLPKTIYGLSKIELQELYTKKYIKEKIKDQHKNNCDPDKTRVDIVKISKTDYTYTGYLNCPSCGGDGYCKTTTTGDDPTVEISFPSEAAGNNLFNGTSAIKIDLDAKGNNALIGSYSYKIYVNGSLKYDSTLKINNKVPNKHIEEKIYKFLPGNIKVVATVTNTEGKTTSKSKTKDFRDTQFPGCGKITYDGAHAMNSYNSGEDKTCGSSGYEWNKIGSNPGTRQVWVVCNDVQGIGCAQHEYSKVLTTDGETDYVEIKDASGNTHNCPVLKCIDKTSSKVTIKIFKAKSDGTKNGSAIETYTIDAQRTNAELTKSDTYSNWFNKSNSPHGIIIELTVEDPSSKIKQIKWYQNEKDQKESSIGAKTNKVLDKTSFSQSDYSDYSAGKYVKTNLIKDDGVREQEMIIIDSAGNKITYTLKVKVDLTAPPVPTISMYQEDTITGTSTSNPISSDSWASKYIWVTTNHPTDSPNVSGWSKNQYSTTGTTGTATNKDGDNIHISAEGSSTVSFRACDVAGNCSEYATESIVKIDRKKPTCELLVSSGDTCAGADGRTWYNSNVKITMSSTSDTGGSGVDAGTKEIEGSSGDYTLKTDAIDREITGTISDNAGNVGTCSIKVSRDTENPTITKQNGYCWYNEGWYWYNYKFADATSGLNDGNLQHTYDTSCSNYWGELFDYSWLSGEKEQDIGEAAYNLSGSTCVWTKACDMACHCVTDTRVWSWSC